MQMIAYFLTSPLLFALFPANSAFQSKLPKLKLIGWDMFNKIPYLLEFFTRKSLFLIDAVTKSRIIVDLLFLEDDRPYFVYVFTNVAIFAYIYPLYPQIEYRDIFLS